MAFRVRIKNKGRGSGARGTANTAVSNRGSGAGQPALGSALLCTRCVTLGKSPSLSVSPSPPLFNRDNGGVRLRRGHEDGPKL